MHFLLMRKNMIRRSHNFSRHSKLIYNSLAWLIRCMDAISYIIHDNYWGQESGPWFNIKMSSYQYKKSHCGDKTVVRSSYLHNGISYTSKMTSLYWIRVLGLSVLSWQVYNDHLYAITVASRNHIHVSCSIVLFMVWCGTILPLSFRLTSLAQRQSYDFPSVNEVTLTDRGK